ncbi:MAG: hypothetical protein JW863_11710 [Chitinispirillaceae bacterium]|nr:hypothetical protein [Chitinispirillaceae bacterium]
MISGSISITSGFTDYQTTCAGCTRSDTSETSSGAVAKDALSSPSAQREEPSSSAELTPDEKKQVTELKKRDREVKAHEAAHMAAGGSYVRGSATYSYQSGPDGKRYAVGGEVAIDTSPEDDPNATIRKMQTVRSAALAPANPSGQDRSVAAAASAQEAKARQELQSENKENAGGAEKPGKKTQIDATGYSRERENTSSSIRTSEVDFTA